MHIRPAIIFLFCVSLFATTLSSHAVDRGPSTPEEREKALRYIDDLEKNPVGSKAKEERQWLTIWLIQVPDIHVGLCAGLLPGLAKGSKLDSDILDIQPMFSSARYAIQHDGGNSDSIEQYQEGVEGTLRTYEALIAQKPQDRQPKMDELLHRRSDGSLTTFVKERVASACKKK
jgi:hypothetical protein